MHIRNMFSTNSATQETLWTGIQLAKLSPGRRHHFIPRMLDKWIERGFATLTDKTITLNTVDGAMKFNVDHIPGRYCSHCGVALANEDLEDGGAGIPQGDPRLGKAARAHVLLKHKGAESPDPSHPAGYKYKMYYGATAQDSVPTINPKARQF